MRALFLLRHSLTEANERHIYCGSTDLPLSPGGRELAHEIADRRRLPACERYVTSGMKRADETLEILASRKPDQVLPSLSEMDFGCFEMQGYETLKHDPDYQRWIGDTGGSISCPGGESSGAFKQRVLAGGAELLELAWNSALVVCHGGVIVQLMGAWFPSEGRGFYEWQPAACEGWRVLFDGRRPIAFESV